MISAIFEAANSGKKQITALFNNQAYHSSAIAVKYITETVIQASLNQSVQLKVRNYPFPVRPSEKFKFIQFDATLHTQLASQIQFVASFLAASFAIMLVREKSSYFKHIQQIGGLRLHEYWLSNFLVDYIIYFLSTLVIILVVFSAQLKDFDKPEEYLCLFVSLMMHGVAVLPLVYLLSLYFREPASAFVRISIYFTIIGSITFLLVELFAVPDFGLIDVRDKMSTTFKYLLPVYTIAEAVFDIYQNQASLNICLGQVPWGNGTANLQDLCQYMEKGSSSMFLACCKGKLFCDGNKV